MKMEGIATFIVLIIFCGAVTFWDLRAGRVPNILNMLGFTTGMIIGAFEGGSGLVNRLCGSLLGIGILLVPFLLKMVGAGDVKFLGAAGAVVGWRILGISFLAGSAIGGAIGFILIIARFRTRDDFNTWLAPLLIPGSIKNLPQARCRDKGPGTRLPYAVPLSLGLILAAGLKLPW